ncbi:MAG: hypothetical protein JNN11_04765 [Candidatus Doudnabacteria bacterium]|nr:hypothetical protein [Candidatus Doudnabacteria bacterium]
MSNSKKILGLVGEKFAGKDAAANYLVKTYSAEHVRFSHVFDEILNILNIPISRANEIAVGNGIRSVFGEGVFVPAIVKRVQSSGSDLVVVNGIRLKEEYEALKALGTKFIYITASADIRFSRYGIRKEKSDDGLLDFKNFMELEKTHTEEFISTLGSRADFKIENNGSLEDLYKSIEVLLKVIW